MCLKWVSVTLSSNLKYYEIAKTIRKKCLLRIYLNDLLKEVIAVKAVVILMKILKL